MKCNKCGNENVRGGRFCIHCGNDMSINSTENKPNYNNQTSYEQPINSNMSNQIGKVSKTGTIVLLVLCILSFNIVGIVLSIVSLVSLSNASQLPDGIEKESKIRNGKTCRTIALIFYIIQLVVCIIVSISMIFFVENFFAEFKEFIENSHTEYIEDNEDDESDYTSDNDLDSSDIQIDNTSDKLECTYSDDTMGDLKYTVEFGNGYITKLIGSMTFDLSGYTDDYIKSSMETLGCNNDGTTCTIDQASEKLLYVSTLSGADLSSYLSEENLNNSITREQIKTLLESRGAECN